MNVSHVGTLSNALPRHAMSGHINTRNANPKIVTRTLKIVRDVRKMHVGQSNNAKCHKTSHEAYLNAGRPKLNEKYSSHAVNLLNVMNSIRFTSWR